MTASDEAVRALRYSPPPKLRQLFMQIARLQDSDRRIAGQLLDQLVAAMRFDSAPHLEAMAPQLSAVM
ncbi:MAG TPA: hypothetical protein VIX59_19130 [Candidatus Binataceae bacterium]